MKWNCLSGCKLCAKLDLRGRAWLHYNLIYILIATFFYCIYIFKFGIIFWMWNVGAKFCVLRRDNWKHTTAMPHTVCVSLLIKYEENYEWWVRRAYFSTQSWTYERRKQARSKLVFVVHVIPLNASANRILRPALDY